MVAKAKSIWMDGELVPWDEAKVHVLTHTLHYGVGAFEGIRAYRHTNGDSVVFRLKEHIHRLFQSAKMIMMTIPYSEQQLVDATLETLRDNGLKEAYVRPIAFVGTGRMGLYAFDNPTSVVISCWNWGAYLGDEGLKNGIRATVSSFVRHFPNSALPKGKICGHYVNSILAKREAMLNGFDEAIMLDSSGMVSEATGENIFLVRDGRVKTPPFSSAILGGITRDTIIQIAKDMGFEVEEATVSRDELYLADEVFLTGTAAEVTPVREIDHRSIGPGHPGPLSKAIQEQYFAVVRGGCSGYDRWYSRV